MNELWRTNIQSWRYSPADARFLNPFPPRGVVSSPRVPWRKESGGWRRDRGSSHSEPKRCSLKRPPRREMCAGSATHSVCLSDCVSVGRSVGVLRAAVRQEAEQEESSAVGQTPPLRHHRANPPPRRRHRGTRKRHFGISQESKRTPRERAPSSPARREGIFENQPTNVSLKIDTATMLANSRVRRVRFLPREFLV